MTNVHNGVDKQIDLLTAVVEKLVPGNDGPTKPTEQRQQRLKCTGQVKLILGELRDDCESPLPISNGKHVAMVWKLLPVNKDQNLAVPPRQSSEVDDEKGVLGGTRARQQPPASIGRQPSEAIVTKTVRPSR